MKKLYLFDVDGTLTKFYETLLLPNVIKWLGNNKPEGIALVSNQGGVGLQHWMEAGGFGDPTNYPSVQDVEDRMNDICKSITRTYGKDFRVEWFAAYRYKSKKSGKWSPIPEGELDSPEWSEDWRKPNDGMLKAALSSFGVSPNNAVMVGDSEEDMLAARSAGIEFHWRDDFFGVELI